MAKRNLTVRLLTVLICTVIALQSMVVRGETYTCSLVGSQDPNLIKVVRRDYLEDREDETGKVYSREKTVWKFTSSLFPTIMSMTQTSKSADTLFLTQRLTSPPDLGFMLIVFLDPMSLKVRVHLLKHPESSLVEDDTFFYGNCMFEESPTNWVPEGIN
jgi:hypothetical protein